MKTTYGLPAKREELIDVLNTAFAEQNLDDEEYENRVKEALNAKCIEDLELVVFDFPKEIKNQLFPTSITTQKSDFPPAAFSSSTKPITCSNSDALSNLFPARSSKAIFTTDKELVSVLTEKSVHFQAVFGTQKVDFRNCRFEGNRFRIDVDSVFSNTTLDLRNQDLAGKHVDIFIKGALNEIKIYIPRGGVVHKNTQVILGEYSIKDKRKGFLGQINKFLGTDQLQPESIAFTITLHGTIFLGNVKVVY
ncbi:MAG: hypothetical protein COZ18_07615 [Flexibacter sp. CG_4_10_14_3_um_filter_32_15]|nr:MAG: hypothetical protein COZ18_07615 [Flexibacter sp. CG_4_10_14_3_um_filter_32_15]